MRVRISQQTGRPVASAVRSWAEFNAVPANQRTIGVNVVGILPGTDSVLRSQAVLVDAHYDHLGIGRAVNGDSIYNGADDDGSGTIAVLEIARILASQPGVKRTVIFAATTGEEVGLVGTNWYIANPPFPLVQTVANFEIEMIGRPDSLSGGTGKGWLTGYERSTMGPMLTAAGIPVVADPRPDQQFFQRSDNIAFARLGIVAHTLSSFNLHRDYHQPSDEVDAVDFDHMARLIDAATRSVWVLANGEIPVWNPDGQPAARQARPVQPPVRPPR
jgi:Zn-dependent M28 family amino/carboxypeptidase